MKGHRHLSVALVLAGVLAAGGVHAQYADELGKLAPTGKPMTQYP